MRILYVSGGSAGHLAPLVAVERAIKTMHPTAESAFLCSDRPEDAEYLRHERVTFSVLPKPRASLLLPLLFVRNYLASRRAIRTFQPDAVFSKGGAVSVPACLAARHAGIPIVLHESDAMMGRANAMVAQWAEAVCTGFPLKESRGQRPEASGQRPAARGYFHTGNPVRPGIDTGSAAEGKRMTGLSGSHPILIVFGGSQGAEALNQAVRSQLDALLTVCDVVHLTGKGKKPAPARAGYWSTEFAYDELPHLYALASLALCRAGAGSISELAANGIPAVLVPIEGLANDHQVRNAEIAAEHGGCTLLRQKDLADSLVPMITTLMQDTSELENMRTKIRTFQLPDAARRIAEILSQCIAKRQAHH